MDGKGTEGSGDPRLDRRYAWAKAALDEGDAAASAEILDQTIAEAPRFTAAWHLYGQAQERLGRGEEAASAWRQCLDLDPDDRMGARLDLARIGALPALAATSEAFAGQLFDDYAERFDSHLVGALGYNAPALLAQAVLAVRPRFASVLDLGCGTGLMGEAIRPHADRLAGCDLSAGMVERARAKSWGGRSLYDKLAVAGLDGFLASRPDGFADLVLAADVFVYLGDLGPAFRQSARVLKPGGVFAFTVQSHDGEGVVVGADRRFHHAESWLRPALAEAGFAIERIEPASTRHDRGAPVPGLLVIAQRA